MATITSLPVAATIDATADTFPIVTNSLNTTQQISRNTFLNLLSQPVGLTDTQVLTNKTLTSPTINGATLSGTLAGTYTIGGTPTFPSTVTQNTASQTLTNKTLTSPTINSPTITNATISADTLTGYTTSNTGTVYGISVTTGTIGSAALASNSVTTTAINNGAVTASKLAAGASQAFVSTSETTTSTSYASLATTTDAATVTIGANGLALVSIFSRLLLGVASGEQCFVGFAISGATTQAATDTLALQYQPWTASAFGQYGATFLVTGLSAGSNTFSMKYRVTSNTGTFLNRRIAVVPL